MAKDVKLPLTGFAPVYIPDVTAIKFVYSDYRVLVATGTQGEYVYRANSVFDPDFTGVGGQPDGFDLWKLLYESYRVVAVKVEVQASTNNSSGEGLLAVCLSPSSASFTSAEEVAGFRKSMAGVFTASTPIRLKRTFHIGELVGVSDATVLTESNYSALVSTNPGTQQYIHVATEMSTATGEAFVWTKITYYTRLEQATSTLDAVTRHRHAFAMQKRPLPRVPPVIAPATPQFVNLGVSKQQTTIMEPALTSHIPPGLLVPAVVNEQTMPPQTCGCKHH